MALVIWLFAGGGEAELGEREGKIKGIIHFFEKHFPYLIFERLTPVRHKRPPTRVNPNAAINALGKTGGDFAKQIQSKLDDKIKYKDPLCDVILILDDLDCCSSVERYDLFNKTINEAGNGAFNNILRIIGFASPELESWIIADWNNTIAMHVDFRTNQRNMKTWLSDHNMCFDSPESFSVYDECKNSCRDKISELLIESSIQKNDVRYSKSKHTPLLLYEYVDPNVVAMKCPIFKNFFTQLQNLNSASNSDDLS